MAPSEAEAENWFNLLKKNALVVLPHITNDFNFAPLIGRGNFANVFVGISKKSGWKYAIKSVDKSKMVLNPNGMVLNKDLIA